MQCFEDIYLLSLNNLVLKWLSRTKHNAQNRRKRYFNNIKKDCTKHFQNWTILFKVTLFWHNSQWSFSSFFFKRKQFYVYRFMKKKFSTRIDYYSPHFEKGVGPERTQAPCLF